MDKQSLSERDICSKFIPPDLMDADWDDVAQIRGEMRVTKGRMIVRGKLVTRGKASRASAATERARLLEALLHEALEPAA